MSTPAFSGPFELLLLLVRREQVEIYDVSIAGITDAYLAEIDRLKSLDLEVATEFLLIAAVLVEMKAHRMLPEQPGSDLDEELEGTSERDLLLLRMLECSTFRGAAATLQSLLAAAARSRPRTAGLVEERWLTLAPCLLEGATPEEVRDAFRRAAAPVAAPRVDIAHITSIEITVGDAVVELAGRLRTSGSVTFRQLTSGIGDRIGLVVRFLAVLEMVKQDLVDVEQADTFGDIVIVWTGGDAPALQAAGAGVDAYSGPVVDQVEQAGRR